MFGCSNEHTEVQVQSNLPLEYRTETHLALWPGDEKWPCGSVCVLCVTEGYLQVENQHDEDTGLGFESIFNTISYNQPQGKIVARLGILIGFYFYCGSMVDPYTVKCHFIIISTVKPKFI